MTYLRPNIHKKGNLITIYNNNNNNNNNNN